MSTGRPPGDDTPSPSHWPSQVCDGLPEVWASAHRPQVPDSATFTEAQPTREADASTRSPPPPALASLLTLPGYDILDEVGRGGMGVVYRAHDRARNSIVALKVMAQVNSSALYRFKQEFRALADVVHPNLVQLYELVADGPHWFFTMELIDGVSFLAATRSGPPVLVMGETLTQPGGPAARESTEFATEQPAGGRFQEARLRDALRQLGEGLCALHAAAKLHRDLKPSNVLVTPAGRVVILDFGLAAELDRRGIHESAEGNLLGTVGYMAPEQAAGKAVSPASDWYSVGVMLYEALTGRQPFRGKMLEVLQAKEQREPPPPRELVPDIPEDLNDLCVALLRRDPAARPSGREVLTRLAGAAAPLPAPVTTTPAPTPLIGRDRHLRALEEAFEAAGQGRTVVVGISGRSGAGKTALLQRFLSGVAMQPQTVVLTGRCYEQESVPYKALDSLVDALSGYLSPLSPGDAAAVMPRDVLLLARVFPVLRRVEAVAQAPRRAEVSDPQEVRRRAFAALRELLARLGDRQRLVLAIDDLQWGDVDSAALLTELLRPPDAPALLLLAGYRSEETEASPFLRTFLPELAKAGTGLDRRELTVEALTPEEARDLSLALCGDQGEAARSRAEAVARESGGNPLFVHELTQNLQSGDSSPAGAVSLDEVLWARVQRLPIESRRLLEVVAVAASPLDQTLACRVADVADGRGALALLRVGRLVRRTGPAEGNTIESYHDRIRETVVAHLAPDTLRQHHHGLALALEADARSDPESLAQHFRGAGEAAKAGGYFARAAAQAAEALAFDRAAKLYRLALELRPTAGEEGSRLRAQLGDALANAGRGREAAEAYLAAAAEAPPTEVLVLQNRAATQLLIGGHIDEGTAVMRTVLKAVGMTLPRTPRRALVSLLLRRLWLRVRGLGFRRRDAREISAEELRRIDICWSAAVGLSIVDTIRGADFQVRHLLMALRAGEPYRIARSLALEAGHRGTAGAGARPQTERILETARNLAHQIGNPHALAMTGLMTGLAAYMEGRWKDALPFCEEADAILRERCTGVFWERATLNAVQFFSLYYLGEVAELARRWPAVLASAEARGDLFASATPGLYLGPMLSLAADDIEGARESLRHFRGQWAQKGFHIQHMHGLLAELEIELYIGEGDKAWQRITAFWSAIAGSVLLRIQRFRIHLLLGRARCALAAEASGGDSRILLNAARKDVRRLWREKVPYGEALAQLVHGGLAVAEGDLPRARELLADAMSRLEAARMGLYAAAARRRLGELCEGEAGQELIVAADAWMTAQGVRNPARLAAMLMPGRFPTG